MAKKDSPKKKTQAKAKRSLADEFPLEHYQDILDNLTWIEKKFGDIPNFFGGISEQGFAVLRDFIRRAHYWCLNQSPQDYVPVIEGRAVALGGLAYAWYTASPALDPQPVINEHGITVYRRRSAIMLPPTGDRPLFDYDAAADLAAALNMGRTARRQISNLGRVYGHESTATTSSRKRRKDG